jgi:hypothetical protein
MAPQNILSETPGNYAIDDSSVSKVNVKLKPNSKGGSGDFENDLEIEFESAMGKYSFRMDEYSENVELLKQVFGDRVKMPFGYVLRRSHGIRIKV